MGRSAKRMAVCAMLTALSVVLMVLGGALELGVYAAPLLAGLCLIPIGRRYGKACHWLTFSAVSLLCLMLAPNPEANLLYIGLLGWYPAARPLFQRLPRLLRPIGKLLLFNVLLVGVQWLVLQLTAPQFPRGVWLWILLILGNITFLLYDRILPRVEAFGDRLAELL